MRQFLFGWYSGPLIALGGLVAVTCLTSTWYLNRLQADLARAVRHDAAGMEAAEDFQLRLRHLRVHSLVLVAAPTDARREVVQADLAGLDAALAAIHATASTPDASLADRIERDYGRYRENLGLDHLPSPIGPKSDLAEWSDAHHMQELLVPCRELVDRQRNRMNGRLGLSEAQTAWAGRVLLGLGFVGVLAGLLSGYATARGLTRRAARLSVRVQAVQAQLDQEVGAMIVEGPPHLGDLDAQLDRVVGRVKEVCQRLQDQERELLRAEELAAVGHLAAGVAHEVRNPLTGVKLLLQAAVKPQSPTPLTPDRLLLLLQEIARIERTVQGLVDFARTPPPARRPHDLRAVVDAAVAVTQSRAEAKSVVVGVRSPPDPVRVEVDDDQMLSLLSNLLVNAIDATPAGGQVEVATDLGPDGQIRVEVTDTGPGIDPTIAGRLFTPFSTTKPTGDWVGPTIARRVARDHGGTLTGANRPAGGTRFTLTLCGPGGVPCRNSWLLTTNRSSASRSRGSFRPPRWR